MGHDWVYPISIDVKFTFVEHLKVPSNPSAHSSVFQKRKIAKTGSIDQKNRSIY
jgi:hypothetical protein